MTVRLSDPWENRAPDRCPARPFRPPSVDAAADGLAQLGQYLPVAALLDRSQRPAVPQREVEVRYRTAHSAIATTMPVVPPKAKTCFPVKSIVSAMVSASFR